MSTSASKTKAAALPPEVVCTPNEKEVIGLVEAASQEHRPFSLVIMDGRIFYGKDYRHLIGRLWQVQRDLHVVLHAVSQLEAYEQIPIDLGANPQLLVFKFRLVPFEITQLIRTLTTRHAADQQSSHRSLNLNAQLLEMTSRFEDVSNRLCLEQDHRRQLEDQLCKNQRLETVGRFAAAMGHFFNNYLTVIQGHLDVALSGGGTTSQEAILKELLIATQRAAGVTSQFVAFNRREYLQPAPLHLPQIIEAQAEVLQKAVGEQISIQINHQTGLPCVMADQASLEQIIFNLLIHARESMPNGGRLMIQTREVNIPDAGAASQLHAEAKPGNYVVMSISDTGRGLTAEEQAGLFDASKLSSGQEGGADIALILVLGLVRMQAGWIDARSVLEVGTEFSIYLPVASGPVPEAPVPGASFAAMTDKKLLGQKIEEESSTILVVDDEDSVRQVMEYVLTSQGHRVLTAADANEAWAIWREKASVIKLALIDVKLPGGVSGFDLEKALANEDPTLPVIFTCGYSPTSLSNAKELKAGENFLPKPFGMVELLNIVGQALLKPARL
ncbi:response regulator [Prosthecobacter vanneervenii]|uniref:histidine kinase n=1 Tax=Prosthecobacter vanneervenii TaxID=48466 RepID=A0A7W7YCQ1_9BACT|nr:response regulator [Prosthecobacter vanneervenii]MBB5033734.1 signal transduction histidine kinase/CheY-like chemotaxis protein [Prosthecobacter vanneervenii]